MTLHNIKQQNPWTNIIRNQEGNYIASCDNVNITVDKKSGKSFLFGSDAYAHKINENNCNLTFKCLPEPFCGDPDSEVYLLGMNPGEPDSLFEIAANLCSPVNNEYLKRAYANLRHDAYPPSIFPSYFWTSGLVIQTNSKHISYDKHLFDNYINAVGKMKKLAAIKGYRPHVGALWQREKTTQLRKAAQKEDVRIFSLEYFPYHSKSGFEFPDNLPSYAYRNLLLEYAMDTDKYIIIMRQEGKWYNIGDRKIGARLKDYEKKLILKNKQGGWISSNNLMLPLPATKQECRCISWDDIIRVL